MYQRDGDTVTLTMTSREYEVLLTALGYASKFAHERGDQVLFAHYLELMNSINKGNPQYTPYEVPKP